MSNSILNRTKKKLGLTEDYTAFDIDVIDAINGVFSTLNQLGVGPVTGFSIDDATAVWEDFFGPEPHPRWNDVKTYVYLKVRMVFDPPQTGYFVTAMEKQIQELEWRINVHREETEWTIPVELYAPEGLVVDGGSG